MITFGQDCKHEIDAIAERKKQERIKNILGFAFYSISAVGVIALVVVGGVL